MEQDCHGDHNDECDELGFAFLIAKSLSVPMLCVSCVANPFYMRGKYRNTDRLCDRFGDQSEAIGDAECSDHLSSSVQFPSVVATGSVIEQNTPDGTSHIKQKEQEKTEQAQQATALINDHITYMCWVYTEFMDA